MFRTHTMSLPPALLALILSLLSSTTCSSQSPTEREQSLDRLRQRISETQDTQTTREPAPDTGTAAPEEESLLLPFRYFGTLPDDDPRVLGVYRMRTHRDPIVDGDTIAVSGLDASLRLVGIDAEEIWHGENELRLRAYTDFPGYLQLMYDGSERFPKFPTPMGDRAHDFARQFFSGYNEVRLEYDDLTRTRGYFGRYLVFVFVLYQGQWLNYNLEAVRARMSPYYPKYGNSLRFHREFLEAEAEARADQRGIWDPSLRHYPDYEERRVWWQRRGRAIDHYALMYEGDPSYVNISNEMDWTRLPELEGQTITVFANISDIHYDWDPARVLLSHRITDDFALISFQPGVLEARNFEQYLGEYIYVRGRLAFYNGRPQFRVTEGLEIWIEP